MKKTTKKFVVLLLVLTLVAGVILATQMSAKADFGTLFGDVVNNDVSGVPSVPGLRGQSAIDVPLYPIYPNITNTNPADIPIESTGLKKASDFELKDLEGKTVKLSDYKGKAVFLNFWASWCPHCQDEMPDLEEVYKEKKNDNDVAILAVNLEAPKDLEIAKQNALNFMRDGKYTFRVLLGDDAVLKNYQVKGFPMSLFINKEGKIVNSVMGTMSKQEMVSNINEAKSK